MSGSRQPTPPLTKERVVSLRETYQSRHTAVVTLCDDWLARTAVLEELLDMLDGAGMKALVRKHRRSLGASA